MASMLLRALRRKFRAREVIAARWVEMKDFYRRLVGRQEMVVCLPCEKKHDNDPARAALFTVIYDGPSVWLICNGCGRKERFRI